MTPEDFIALGFNRNEAIVYVALLRYTKADAHQIIKDTKFHKNIVYDNLTKLIDRGLVTSIEENGKRYFSITSANALVMEIETKEKELSNKKQRAKEIQKQIKEIQKEILQEQHATVYRGIKSIKAYYRDVLEKGDMDVFGAPIESVELMGEYFWINHDKQRSALKRKTRMIFNESIRSHGKKVKSKYTKVRYFEKDFEPLTETTIQENQVAIIVWIEEPILFLIESENVASSYRVYFEKLWKEAQS